MPQRKLDADDVTVTLTVKCPSRVLAALRAISRGEGLTVGALVREIIRDYLDIEGGEL